MRARVVPFRPGRALRGHPDDATSTVRLYAHAAHLRESDFGRLHPADDNLERTLEDLCAQLRFRLAYRSEGCAVHAQGGGLPAGANLKHVS
jgi:hypothetical protein